MNIKGKSIFTLSIAILLTSFVPQVAFATETQVVANVEQSLGFTLNSKGTYDVNSADTGITGKVEIPATYNGKAVTGILAGAFDSCNMITEIVVPDSVTNIGEGAFSGCNGLTAITVPFVGNSAKGEGNINQYPFGYIFGTSNYTGSVATKQMYFGDTLDSTTETTYYIPSSLKTVTVTSHKLMLGAFSSCANITTVNLGNGVTSIGMDAFYNCSSLTNVNMSAGVTAIDSFAFESCTGLQTIDIGQGVKTVSSYAFNGCSNLKSVILPTGVTYIGESAFPAIMCVWYEGTDNSNITIGDNALVNTIWHYGVKRATFADKACLYCAKCDNYFLEDGSYALATVVFKNWDGKELSRKSYFYGQSIIKPTNPTKPADSEYTYTFTGWDGDTSKCTGNAVYTAVFKAVHKNGWFTVNGKEYYYQNNAMVKNKWVKDSIGWRYLGSDGAVVKNSWLKDSAGWSYANSNGYAVVNSWMTKDGKKLYLDENGSMKKNAWIKTDGKWYYTDSEGYMVTNAWAKDSKGLVYLGSDGAMVTNAWVSSNGKWYYVNASGYKLKNTWKADSVGLVYLGSDGAMATNTWIKDSTGYRYVGGNGYIVKNKWIKTDGKWYYAGSNGYRLTNKWQKDSKGWVYLGSDGAMVINTWQKDSKGWCYLGSDGYMSKNTWVKTDGKWYYVDNNGYRVVNKSMTIGGKTYKFNSSGVCTNK